MAEKKKNTNKKVEEKDTKKTTPKTNTAKKTNNTKKANTANKPKTNNKPAAKKTTTAKANNNKPKKTNKSNKPKVAKVKPEVVEVKVEETDVVIAPVKIEEPEVIENPVEEEEEYVPTIEDTQKIEAVIKQEEVTEEAQEKNLVDKKKEAIKCEKRIDLGIGIVLLGLVLLIVTTYLSSATQVGKNVVDGLVIGSLAIELIGIIVIVYNTVKSNK